MRILTPAIPPTRLPAGLDPGTVFVSPPLQGNKLFAWEAVERGAWEDAEFIRPIELRG